MKTLRMGTHQRKKNGGVGEQNLSPQNVCLWLKDYLGLIFFLFFKKQKAQKELLP